MKIWKVEMICGTDEELRMGINCSIQDFLDNIHILDIEQELITKKNYKDLDLFNEEYDLGDWEEDL